MFMFVYIFLLSKFQVKITRFGIEKIKKSEMVELYPISGLFVMLYQANTGYPTFFVIISGRYRISGGFYCYRIRQIPDPAFLLYHFRQIPDIRFFCYIVSG